ncbi:MAG: Asp23/Gls24 family envelope stress response protein [Firmicutes bacterium]|nr:Asp23/Gls24 family envelope stress response protein [Bacillota bacterium]
MSAEIKTELGNITLTETVIARIAGLAATECYGVIGMAAKSVKDGIVMLLKKDSLTRGVIVRVTENVISVDLHVIMEYGINIPAISETISSTVKYKVQEFTGFDVDVVNIYVEGIRVDDK